MKKFITFIVNRPTTVFVTLVSMFIIGFISISRLSINYLPNMEVPIISIKTTYDNAGAEEVEKSVTRVIESAVSSVNNVKTIKSKSKESESNVEIEFNWGTDLQTAADDIREAIDMIRSSLPDDADNPNISKFSTDSEPIMNIAFFGTDNLASLYDLVDSQILTRLEQVEGVAQTEIRGGLKKIICVDIDLNRLNAYSININDIVHTLSLENQNVAGGETYEGVYKYNIRTTGEFKEVNDIEDVVIMLKNQVYPVKVRDIAYVHEDYEDDSEIVRINGQKALTIAVTKESGGNIIQIARDVEKRLSTINLPSGVYYQILFNSSDTIKNSIHNVLNTVWQGALFAVLVLMIYLWDIRSVFIISISIPVSVITTFILMYFFNITINVISLSGLVLGVGMMVDNSIVVLENIFYYSNYYSKYNINKNDKRTIKINNIKSSIIGTSEVSIAITASTLTSVCVFLPFLFVKGQMGQMFSDLCITVSISLLTSLFVALTIVPLLASRLNKLNPDSKLNLLLIRLENFFNKNLHNNIEKFYVSTLAVVIKNKKKSFALISILLSLSLFLLLTNIGKEGYPVSDEGTIISRLRLPVGARVEFTDMFINKMEHDIESAVSNNMAYYETRVRTGRNEHHGEVRVKLIDRENGRKFDISHYIESIRNKVDGYPGRIELNSENTAMGKPKNYSAIIIELVGDDLDRGYDVASNVIAAVNNVEGVRNVLIKEDDSNHELIFDVDRDLVSKMGININTIANIIRTSFSGTTASKMTLNNSIYVDTDIIVRLEDRNRDDISSIQKMMIPTSNGIVPISSLVDIHKSTGPIEINRKNDKRIIEINASAYGRPINEIITDIRKELNKIYIPSGFSVNFSGDYEDMQEAFVQLIVSLIMALVFVYAIIAGQFESYITPFVISLAVPFALFGALIFLYFSGNTLNVYSGIGIIMLVGIVVNNGIVLIDYMNRVVIERKIRWDNAALESCKRRLRPVLMTSLTTILGLLPMIFEIGSGSEMYRPLAIAVCGGLIFSTMFTLIIIPSVYSSFRNRFNIKIRED
ncbi:efflux RND transporter permease subunit [Brachyspira hyodysenteriae]|uniref:efflux RND transporter permease subunit n=1 Tax=Brachyspira hyodysenteriae TaxID=159 RepID=UPI00063D9CFE|nr:efflux RND transporter permease subunit [Brachyspira hyodysenteriae]KLI14394.1 multidrug transporter [Brachyspira hyodysenteriae]MBT8720581.1 efflux RND transporter permease subunit [Brachyspira hyodysenteriae]MBT8730733.1 efflux RND transporter permease subunit [Brachyspira hyodysenteriae]MBT8733181.1 efflux RND transporter permease subunit [Brachyspira hyodysenteriae]MBT8735829.1 efflux RND transporter permease subunit [Brachyspira hyodysenteriae]